MKKFGTLFVLFLVFAIVSNLYGQVNPFTENTVTINQNPAPNQAVVANDAEQPSAASLQEALRKLAETQENFARLLKAIATNPMKFIENGSLASIYEKVASIQKRLSSLAATLLEMAKESGISIADLEQPSGNESDNSSSNTGSNLTPPAPRSTSARGGISSRSAEFAQWFANGVRISQDWNFPELTNMYGQKVSREAFLKSIIYIESSGIHQRANGQMVTSSCGALGFMQLMPNTARGLGVNPRDPAQNIQGGSKYFNTIFNRGTVGSKSGLDKIIMAGCAYNMGPYSSKLKQPWSSFLASNSVSKGPKMYGLKVKMCLGIELNQNERRFVGQNMARGKSVDEYARNLYSYAQGIGR